MLCCVAFVRHVTHKITYKYMLGFIPLYSVDITKCKGLGKCVRCNEGLLFRVPFSTFYDYRVEQCLVSSRLVSFYLTPFYRQSL